MLIGSVNYIENKYLTFTIEAVKYRKTRGDIFHKLINPIIIIHFLISYYIFGYLSTVF